MRFLRLLFLAVLLVPSALPADSFASPAEARQLADRVVALFVEEKIVAGYDLLKPYWPLAPVEIDSLANQTGTQWPVVKQRFGASLASEFISARQAGQSLVELVYLHKFERHAIRWVFVFYKPADRWLINGVSFDDSIELLFAAK